MRRRRYPWEVFEPHASLDCPVCLTKTPETAVSRRISIRCERCGALINTYRVTAESSPLPEDRWVDSSRSGTASSGPYVTLASSGRAGRRERPSRGGFRTVELNPVGWSALIGIGIGIGGLAVLARVPLRLALPGGVLAAWGAALIKDRRRWRASPVRLHVDLERSEAEAVVDDLGRRGVDAELLDERFDGPEGEVVEQRSILVRQVHVQKARALVATRSGGSASRVP